LPLPLHRYRLTGELTEIRSDDMAFTERETEQLMAQHAVVLRRESVQALRARTEGWAAGLRLAAMSMNVHPDPDGLVARWVGRAARCRSPGPFPRGLPPNPACKISPHRALQ
ncbi:MAG TPA: hypothetical protein VHH34_13485, partial [Pseudonocardiaceae bacterium]|nr:hypothetical protein [Pseudonocardiaceae bacterium]